MAKKFTFRLEALLTVKKNKEDAVKQRLAKKHKEIEECRMEIVKLQDDLKAFQASTKQQRKDGKDDVTLMRQSVAYRNQMKLELLKTGQHLDSLMVELYKINDELVKASQERRAVEIIKENRYAEWKKEVAAAEQKFVDELAQQSFIRKHRE